MAGPSADSDNLYKYACDKIGDLDKLSKKVDGIGWFGRWWESEEKEVIKKDITTYRKYYEDVKDVTEQVCENKENADEVVEKLLKLQVEAKSKMKSTRSSILYRLHAEFVEGHEVDRLKGAELIAVRQRLKRTKDDLQASAEEIRNVTEKFNSLLNANEQFVRQQEELRQENAQIRSLLQELLARRISGNDLYQFVMRVKTFISEIFNPTSITLILLIFLFVGICLLLLFRTQEDNSNLAVIFKSFMSMSQQLLIQQEELRRENAQMKKTLEEHFFNRNP